LFPFFTREKKPQPQKPSPQNPCPDCGTERMIWYFERRKQLYCPKCMTARIDLPDSVVESFVGRIMRLLKKEFMARFLVEYPTGRKGEEFWLYYGRSTAGSPDFYVNHIYAIAGKFKDDKMFEPFYAKDLTINKERFVAAYPSMFPDFDYGKYIPNLPKKGRFEGHPYSLVARKVVHDITRDFESSETMLEHPGRQTRAKDFEALTKNLLEKIGYVNVTITGGVSDKGIDLEAYQADENGTPIHRVIIQCKCQSLLNRIKPSQVREFAYVIEREKQKGVERGYFITSSYFSPECYDKTNCGDDMELIDRDYMEKLLKKYSLHTNF